MINMTETSALSAREREVVNHLLQGKSNKLIASALGISARTVEFHLKNVYAKYRVSSRIELILKLGNTTGFTRIDKLGYSTVAPGVESAENRDMPGPGTDWVPSFVRKVSKTGKELNMKNLLNTQHVPVGMITAILTGATWMGLLARYGHMAPAEIAAWILPLILVWAVSGLAVGWVGKHNGSTLLKICISTLLGTGLSPITILPLMGFVVLPIGKFAEWLGLIDPATISSDAATRLAIICMLLLWHVVGMSSGIMLLFVTIQKPEQTGIQKAAPEHGL
jgi:DNA-binding CsgD family transcriptional regulator